MENGYGFRIVWKPLMSTGAEKTEIEFGYLMKNGYTSYSSYVVPSIAVQKHTFAFFSGNGYAKIIADGISEYIPFGQSNDLWDLSENINLDGMYLQYSADNKYPDTYSGKWLVKLENTVEIEPTDWYVNNAEMAQITGNVQSGSVEYDYRMYPTIAENQTVSINGAAQDIVVCGNKPVKLYSKIALNLEMTLKVSEIPAYRAENAFILISFSNIAGGITTAETTATAFIARLSWQDANTLAVYCKMGIETKEYSVRTNGDEIKLEFGWSDSDSVIKVNGNVVLAGSFTKGHFGSSNGVQGYFAVRTYNGSPEENAKWAFTLSAPKHIDATVDDDEPEDSTSAISSDKDSSDVQNGKKKGCGSAAVGMYATIFTLCLAAALFFGLLFKKEKDITINK